jgi:hypothetical protein
MEFYNDKIQLDKKVIDDIFQNINMNIKMLVFGLGYDSKMWYEGNHKNTYFIENNDQYIQLNKNDIPDNNIIKYDYKITCESSFKLIDEEINTFEIPEYLLKLSPFDIILIDGPEGWKQDKPGRLIPCYWATLLSKNGTLIYIDDSNRLLESFCIEKYFSNKNKIIFTERNNCTKIIN